MEGRALGLKVDLLPLRVVGLKNAPCQGSGVAHQLPPYEVDQSQLWTAITRLLCAQLELHGIHGRKKKIGCNRGQKQPSWSKIAADSYRSVTSCIVRQWHQTRKKTNQINLKLYLLVPPPESFASRCHIFSLCEAGLNIPPSEGRMTSCNTIP